MPDTKKYLSKIVKGSDTLWLKDAEARESIEDIYSKISGGLHYLGKSTTPIADGDATGPWVIDGVTYVVSNPSDPVSVTAIAPSITMTSYDDYTTPDGFKEFNVPEGSILLVRLTGSGGTLVVSHKPLSLATRTAIENKIETGEGLQAQWKTPVVTNAALHRPKRSMPPAHRTS